MPAPSPKRPSGRPRSDAARAGVGKATVCRWWPSKGAVAMEAFLAGLTPRIAYPHTDSAVDDIVTRMLRLAEAYRGAGGRVVCELIALGWTGVWAMGMGCGLAALAVERLGRGRRAASCRVP